jgi:hypothetical protein
MKISFYIILLSILFKIYGCSKALTNQRSKFIFEKSYLVNDSICIKEFVINSYYLSNVVDFKNFNQVDSVQKDLNNDSILYILKKTLTSLDVPIKFMEESININDSVFIKNLTLSFYDFDLEKIKSIRCEHNLSLIPILSIINEKFNDDSFIPYRSISKRVRLSVFILKNEDIVYYKSNRISSILRCSTNDCKLEDVVIGQDLWDDLVYQVMRQYIKRLK